MIFPLLYATVMWVLIENIEARTIIPQSLIEVDKELSGDSNDISPERPEIGKSSMLLYYEPNNNLINSTNDEEDFEDTESDELSVDMSLKSIDDPDPNDVLGNEFNEIMIEESDPDDDQLYNIDCLDEQENSKSKKYVVVSMKIEVPQSDSNPNDQTPSKLFNVKPDSNAIQKIISTVSDLLTRNQTHIRWTLPKQNTHVLDLIKNIHKIPSLDYPKLNFDEKLDESTGKLLFDLYKLCFHSNGSDVNVKTKTDACQLFGDLFFKNTTTKNNDDHDVTTVLPSLNVSSDYYL